ncbi:hypothetical protein K1T71_004223 [Dendrolimus kikuchii]|uniref:Uncharacterized protein n=1 Tax=Dendrolimus kikuchii TaxID=765133 RepID=A0ACC1DAM8_9NEOP|nr:hypothetical protein K1T71_004223 [Dendrolimus kikuchii]
MEKSWFRLSICLKHFFADERAQCYVSAERHRPVRWLRRRLLRLFGAPLGEREGSTFALTCRGHLLPDDEPLALLCHDDLISASGKAELEISEVTANNECEESSDLKRLQDLKQRAFNLLNQYNRNEDDPITSPKRKRRRVRKRRQPRDLAEGHNQAEQSLYDVSESCENPAEEPQERDMHMEPVARNTSLEVRPARLVQSLTVESVG